MPTMFPGASQFNTGDITQINHISSADNQNDASLKELYSHLAVVALHGSSARVDAPKCHEETRKALQEDIYTWSGSHFRRTKGEISQAALQAEKILWLTGPAGTGKTAIMGTVSDCFKGAHELAATFYFSSAMGAAGTTSKQFFVTSLAYQLAIHPRLRDRLQSPILSAVRSNPAIFHMSLKEQLGELVLQPLRSTHAQLLPKSTEPTCILVDGVDECEGSGEGASRRSRQDNQIEILSLLLDAINDPTFPFHIILASRPETWIRRFFEGTAAGTYREIFLDEKYGPDDDIRLYLKSKFAGMAGQRGINASTWPSRDAIDKLVVDASGQFIYAATVVRFVDTPGANIQAQLKTVLDFRTRNDIRSNPLAMLDGLYTSILKFTADPKTTVLWLKGLQLAGSMPDWQVPPSAWTVDRIFETYEGEARYIYGGLPSLVCKRSERSTDVFEALKRQDPATAAEVSPPVDCDKYYAFYHKSFLDYLKDDSRCVAAFPEVTQAKAKVWVVGRFEKTFRCGGPEVPVPPLYILLFRSCFLDLAYGIGIGGRLFFTAPAGFSDCNPRSWLDEQLQLTSRYPPGDVVQALFLLAHDTCRPFFCKPTCKRWRQAISDLPYELRPRVEDSGRSEWSLKSPLLQRLGRRQD